MHETSNHDPAMNAVANPRSQAFEAAIVGGDLKNLSSEERLNYYRSVCASLDLNPLTKPFEYITLNGKLTLYARKDCTDQLRTKRGVSVKIMAREVVEGCYIVTAKASVGDREDESIGAVPIDGLKGEARANAMMKAETKAKRRVTLSFCGLGMLDESEVDSIPTAIVGEHPHTPAVTDAPKPDTTALYEHLCGVIDQIADAKKCTGQDVANWLVKTMKSINSTAPDRLAELPEKGLKVAIKKAEAKLAELTDVPPDSPDESEPPTPATVTPSERDMPTKTVLADGTEIPF